MDRMRESLFSILGSLEELSFLDLFSGSGLVGIEAWSRGARPVMLVERDRGKRSVILRNIEQLAPPPVLRIEPVERFIQRNRSSFDVVYLDPPFDYPYKADVLRRLVGSRTVTDGSIVLIHAPAAEDLPERIERSGPGTEIAGAGTNSRILGEYDRRDYGGSRLHFYRVTGGE
jgi:16S rRNA (guanine(966)-N(2))-methyltransferase RsmD